MSNVTPNCGEDLHTRAENKKIMKHVPDSIDITKAEIFESEGAYEN